MLSSPADWTLSTPPILIGQCSLRQTAQTDPDQLQLAPACSSLLQPAPALATWPRLVRCCYVTEYDGQGNNRPWLFRLVSFTVTVDGGLASLGKASTTGTRTGIKLRQVVRLLIPSESSRGPSVPVTRGRLPIRDPRWITSSRIKHRPSGPATRRSSSDEVTSVGAAAAEEILDLDNGSHGRMQYGCL